MGQVVAVGVAYSALMNEAKAGLAHADWFVMHEDRLPQVQMMKFVFKMMNFLFQMMDFLPQTVGARPAPAIDLEVYTTLHLK